MCIQEVIDNKVYISLCMRKLGLLIITYKCTDEECVIGVWIMFLHAWRRETHAIYVHVCARRHEKNPREAIADWLRSRGDGFDAIADWFGCLLIFFSSLETSFSSLDGRKGAKEDQGVRDAGQVSRVPGKVPSPGRGRQGHQPSWPGAPRGRQPSWPGT